MGEKDRDKDRDKDKEKQTSNSNCNSADWKEKGVTELDIDNTIHTHPIYMPTYQLPQEYCTQDIQVNFTLAPHYYMWIDIN